MNKKDVESTYLIKNGRNGEHALTIRLGRISANKMAPVDIIWHSLSVSGLG